MSDELATRIRNAVNEVPDPCSVAQGLATGLVDMGLLCDIELGAAEAGRRDVLVRLRLIGPGCLYGIHFEREVRTRLEAMSDVATIDVEFSREFDWSPDDIAPHVKQELRIRRDRLIAELPLAQGSPPVAASDPG